MGQNRQLNYCKGVMTNERDLRVLAESNERLNICLTNDFAFKHVFHNKKALKGLLGAFFQIPPKEISEIEFLDTYLYGEYEDSKEEVVDIRLQMKDGRKVTIEMQVEKFPFWENRTLYYLCKMFIEGLKKGEGYDNLEQCVQISLLNFDLYKNPPLYWEVGLWDQKNERLYSDKLNLRVLQLNQLENATEEEKETDIYRWAQMISADSWEVFEMLAQKDEYMQAAKEEMEKINADKALRYKYLKEEMAASDKVTIRNYYTQEGYREGEKAGEKNAEERFGKLNLILIEEKRYEDLERASKDESYRKRLFREYNL